MPSKRCALVDSKYCVACGSCLKVCPVSALTIWRGVVAQADPARCVGCGKCVHVCPAGTIELREREELA